MSLSHDQAAESLKEIDQTSRRSALAYGYASASPHLIMWGILWMIGYGISDLSPGAENLHWTALLVIGIAGGMLIGRRQRLAGLSLVGSAPDQGLRFFATFFAIGMFITATYAIFGHAGPRQQAAFVPLIVALIYAVMGIWKGLRFLVMGIVIAALTLGGFFFLNEHFLLWMAVVGGGALLLGGLWLRTV